MEVRVIETAREALADLEDFLLAPSERRYEQRPSGNLTPRERDVLVLLAEGFRTGEVAEHLSVSEHTVRSRIRTILVKLGARNREHAVAIAVRQRVV
jgi:LuxR family transcriptional regulator, quorum-sensing system regulator BjaR1